MKPELAELPVLATLSNLRLMSSLRSHPELERRALPSWDCGCYQSHARVNVMRHHVKSLLKLIYCLPCKPQSHPSYFSSSWKGFHTCRIPQLSLTDLSVQRESVEIVHKFLIFPRLNSLSTRSYLHALCRLPADWPHWDDDQYGSESSVQTLKLSTHYL